MTVRVSMKQALCASLALVLLPAAGAAQTDRVQIYSYDARGQMMSGTTVNPGGGDLVTQFDYDDAGNLIEVTDPAGRQVRAAYDDARRMISTTGAPGTGAQTHSRFRYDVLGRLTHLDASPDGSSAPASWVTTQASYTPYGATASVIDPAGDTSQFSYYRNGWLNVSTDPEGRQARNWYYDDGMPREMAEAYGSTEEVRAVRFYFNAIGNQTGHRPAKGLSANPGVSVNTDDFDAQYSFDAYNRRSQWRLPERDDGSRLNEQYQYDAAGNMTQRTTRAGEIITTEYDASDRPWRVTTPDGVTTTTYNIVGETTRMVGPDQHSAGQWQLDYTYDFAGRMTSEAILNPQGVSRTVSYEYDAAGNRTRITWPDGFSARYVYNAANQLTEVWMDSAGGTAMRIAIYSYDGQGRLERYRLTGVNNALVGDIDFTYEIDGDLAQMDYSFGSGTDFTLDYSYDRSGWLTGRTVDNPAWDWSPSTSQVALSSDTYAANRMDQYTTVSSQAMSYDLNGNLTSDGSRSFVFSSQNQLLSATTSSGTSTYSYGPANRRVRKATAGGVVTDFLMAGEMVIAEYDGTGQLLRRYIPGAGVDQRVMMIQCNGSATCEPPEYTTARYQFYLPDRQGNVLATIYQGGNVEQQFHYTPFGVEMVGDPTGNPFRYTGRYYDAETDLYYYRARYYDADLGRFLSVDPIGYADQWNLYAYVGNSPLMLNDPTGEQSTPGLNDPNLRQLTLAHLSDEELAQVHAAEMHGHGAGATFLLLGLSASASGPAALIIAQAEFVGAVATGDIAEPGGAFGNGGPRTFGSAQRHLTSGARRTPSPRERRHVENYTASGGPAAGNQMFQDLTSETNQIRQYENGTQAATLADGTDVSITSRDNGGIRIRIVGPEETGTRIRRQIKVEYPDE